MLQKNEMQKIFPPSAEEFFFVKIFCHKISSRAYNEVKIKIQQNFSKQKGSFKNGKSRRKFEKNKCRT